MQGLPKTGSTSLHRFFRCAGLNTSHFHCTEGERYKAEFCGLMMQKCASLGLPFLSCTPGYDAYLQIDFDFPNEKGGLRDNSLRTQCFFPQISGLGALLRDYPTATYVLTYRDPLNWARSTIRFYRMDIAIARCNLPGVVLVRTRMLPLSPLTTHTPTGLVCM